LPNYDYQCDACDHRFEKFQSMSEPAIKKCPKCGKLKVRRLIGSGAGIIFKGSGFYQTDYKNKPSEDSKKKDSPKPGAGASSAPAPKSPDSKSEKKK